MSRNTILIIFSLFVIFLIILLLLNKYYFDDTGCNVINHRTDKVRCPPFEFKINNMNSPKQHINIRQNDNEYHNKNDLNITNTFKINMYKEGDMVNQADGFHSEVIQARKQEFTPELEYFFNNSEWEDDHVANYEQVKSNKSDLPIVDVPLHLLRDNKPLKLSDKPL